MKYLLDQLEFKPESDGLICCDISRRKCVKHVYKMNLQIGVHNLSFYQITRITVIWS